MAGDGNGAADLPGNFAMMFSIGMGPSGVCAVKLSRITSHPRIASCCLIIVRSLEIAGEPSGRGHEMEHTGHRLSQSYKGATHIVKLWEPNEYPQSPPTSISA